MKPLISIIIPTYNRAQIIGETLDSIIAQNYTNWECIVVDDGSTDNTQEILQNYIAKDTRFQYHQRPKDKLKGPNSCRNYGFKLSKGEFINFFDSDDFLKPDAFQVFVNQMNEKDDVDAIISKSELIDFFSRKKLKENKIFSNNLIEDLFVEKITFYICGPFWNRNYLLKQNYLFDENIGNGDDWDFNLRMVYNNPTLIFIKETPQIQIRVHKDSFSQEKGKLNKKELLSDFKALEKHLELVSAQENINLKVIRDFIIKRYNRALKWALFQENKLKYFLLKEALKKQVKFGYYNKMIKTIIGFFLYSVFKKGYHFLKD
ncbi:MAG: glycosyltransferase family 2 protein [Arcobacter sp.]|nr:glycosyltransferase family 2 protein [Arcobacter sp.]